MQVNDHLGRISWLEFVGKIFEFSIFELHHINLKIKKQNIGGWLKCSLKHSSIDVSNLANIRKLVP